VSTCWTREKKATPPALFQPLPFSMATAGRVLPVEAPVARGLRAKVRR